MESSTREQTVDKHRPDLANYAQIKQEMLDQIQLEMDRQMAGTAGDDSGHAYAKAVSMGFPILPWRVGYVGHKIFVQAGPIITAFDIPPEYPESGEAEVRVKRCEIENGVLKLEYNLVPVAPRFQVTFAIGKSKEKEPEAWLPTPDEVSNCYRDSVSDGSVTKPQPKFGWWGQSTPEPEFPIGTKVIIGTSGMMGEVIEMGTPPKACAHLTDLVHIRIIKQGQGRYAAGTENYWQTWQLERI